MAVSRAGEPIPEHNMYNRKCHTASMNCAQSTNVHPHRTDLATYVRTYVVALLQPVFG